MHQSGLLLLFSCVFATTETFLIAPERAPLTVTRLYTGADGLSHFERIHVKFAPLPGEPRTVVQSESLATSKSYFVRCAPGFFSDWHNADVRRYVITISGRAEVEVAGGEKFIAQPGEVVLAEDLTGKGHTFRVLDNNAWVAVFVDMGKSRTSPKQNPISHPLTTDAPTFRSGTIRAARESNNPIDGTRGRERMPGRAIHRQSRSTLRAESPASPISTFRVEQSFEGRPPCRDCGWRSNC